MTSSVCANGIDILASRNSRHAPKPRKFSRLGYDLAHHFDVRVRKRHGGNDRNQVLVKNSHSDISEELWVGSDHGGVEHEDHLAGAGRNRERENNAIPRRHCRGLFQFQPIPDHRLEHHGDVADVGADPEDVWNAGLKAPPGSGIRIALADGTLTSAATSSASVSFFIVVNMVFRFFIDGPIAAGEEETGFILVSFWRSVLK
jgi:hypothetical protein